jgi:hypothetical protein
MLQKQQKLPTGFADACLSRHSADPDIPETPLNFGNGRKWWKADRLLFRVYPHSRRLQAEWPIVVGGGPLSALRPLLPEHVICNHAEPDEKAERRADQKKGQVHGDGSRPAPTIRLVAHA